MPWGTAVPKLISNDNLVELSCKVVTNKQENAISSVNLYCITANAIVSSHFFNIVHICHIFVTVTVGIVVVVMFICVLCFVRQNALNLTGR